MSGVVLLEPHYDDAVLFASYTLLKEKPTVITVLGGDTVQEPEITARQRANENWRALSILLDSPNYEWDHSERNPDWEMVVAQMIDVRIELSPDVIWVPLMEDDGHEQHNEVSREAIIIFGAERCRFYATYRRGSGRTRTDNEVIPEPGWRAKKYAAMACFASQIEIENTRPWFCSDDCLREWIA